ncbi:MAG: hypothetical protein M3081_21265 [Gemmatimonadota bacterium]|nr:hypothetical protein [Gemmatimonadota bacterium]
MRKLSLVSGLCSSLVALVLAGPSALVAQAQGTQFTTPPVTLAPLQLAPVQPAPVEAVSATAGPVNGAASAAFQTPIAHTARVATIQQDSHMGAGQNVALMGVGAAGLITGLIIGGKGGTAVAIGGGLIGLYGLYRFLQ